MSKRLILWDFDGTLADTGPLALELFNELADERGFRRVADPQLARTLPTREFLRQQGIRFWQLPRLVRIFLKRLGDRIVDTDLFPDVARMLHELGAQLPPMGILSSNVATSIRVCLERHGVSNLFGFVAGSASLFGKHRRLSRICRQEKLLPSEVVYIGDESRDVDACHRAGIDVIAVTWGYHSAELLRQKRPQFLAESADELRETLLRICADRADKRDA